MDRLRQFLNGLRDKAGKKTGDVEVSPSQHASLTANDPFSFQAMHRRMAWMLRLSTGYSIAVTACLVVAMNTIAGMVPLKEKEPIWIEFEPEDKRTVRIKPVVEDVVAFDVMLEGMARRYVKVLLEIDPVTQEPRMREASRMTDKTYWEKFKREWIDSGQITEALESGLDREIIIESANKVSSLTGDYKFAVDFTRIDKRNGKPVSAQPIKLRAYLSMAKRPQNVTIEEKYSNPFGITVTDMVLRTRGAS
tara:strand:- start:147 stop:896 length:750 start_codon:yes stop_codon:yes gene_type:complete